MQILPAVLTDEVATAETALAAYRPISQVLHVDVLDDSLVPGRTLLPAEWPLMTDYQISWHLMVAEPERYLDDCLRHATSEIIIHAELGVGHLEAMISELTRARVPIGLAINPDTPVALIATLIDRVQSALVLTVQPGRQGGEFLPDQLLKLAELRSVRPELTLAVDGGISATTIHRLMPYRPARVVVGSFLKPGSDLQSHWQELNRMIK